jgi:hypothetical protein
VKFLCVDCDRVMEYVERRLPGDGTMAVVYACPVCERETALLTNPMETRLVSGLGIEVGGRTVPPEPLELVRSSLEGFDSGGEEARPAVDDPDTLRPGQVRWSGPARERLLSVPSFVRGMVKGSTASTPRSGESSRSRPRSWTGRAPNWAWKECDSVTPGSRLTRPGTTFI